MINLKAVYYRAIAALIGPVETVLGAMKKDPDFAARWDQALNVIMEGERNYNRFKPDYVPAADVGEKAAEQSMKEYLDVAYAVALHDGMPLNRIIDQVVTDVIAKGPRYTTLQEVKAEIERFAEYARLQRQLDNLSSLPN